MALSDGQRKVLTIVAPGLQARALGVRGWFSTNILGNRDGLVLDDPDYENGDLESRLGTRLRLADDVVLLAMVQQQQTVLVRDRDADQTINVASDERFIRSLDRLGLVSLEPTMRANV